MNYFEESLSKKELSELVVGYAQEKERLEAEIDDQHSKQGEAEFLFRYQGILIRILHDRLERGQSPEDIYIPISAHDPLLRNLKYPLKVLSKVVVPGVGVKILFEVPHDD